MSYTKKDYYEPSTGDQFASVVGHFKSQSFQASSSYTINKITLRLTRSGTYDTITYYVRLYNADGSGLPTGSPLATFGSFAWSDLTSSYANYSFIDSSYGVTNGQNYCIVINYTDEENDAVYWFTNISNGYANGVAAQSDWDGSWSAQSSYDRWFQLYESDDSLPSKPINPTPADETGGITLHGRTVSWEDGGGATSYNVYYGTLSGFLEVVESGITDTEADLIEGNFDHYGEIYYWRVDAVNEYGTTTGDEWYFTTIVFKTPPPGGRGRGDGETGGSGGDVADDVGDGNMTTRTRLIAFARNKVFYEDM